jgi:hypothetical protein
VVGQVYITLIGIITSLGVLLALPAGAAWVIMTLLVPHLSIMLVAAVCLIVALAIITLEWLGLARLLGAALDRLEPSDVPSLQA